MKKTPSLTAQMFNSIASYYDFLNHFFSLGIDYYWRRVMCRFLPQTPFTLLDCATGTGDQLLAFLKKSAFITSAYGIDPASKMLEKARIKLSQYHSKVSLVEASVEHLPFQDEMFHTVSISFGIRNVEDLSQSLLEIHRVLKPQGELLILEFSHPTHFLIRPLYFFYLNKLLPLLGKLISRHQRAYSYLAETIKTFPQGKALCEHLETAGFKEIHMTPLSLGIVTIYRGKKP
ncbi:bifunctional demethylmenaquinone methyltransferase/2-methoxy-6-polyprenyl-1,4-benzoquinol methylase UbiE [Rhabdochlamydiaceae symbiont of Dictyostelium giganteum]|uniref:bifunctional demethylmenaquinone methyltransferase/2-methoxy-6-polyprenyl-1,4-benzoquinol methylase UbiE n=1 Tax=Rhabdochlamydiaceae symbiont of Dictyostelium giganteum TaxID=3342349 RepID=UPI00384A627B